ncbi:hypothetical protein BDD12DRAFT_893271 [Trichophaea hybrida]|nr:hypothetical protein BDD12DRAFT_893271 [Trichophaea hybrida]
MDWRRRNETPGCSQKTLPTSTECENSSGRREVVVFTLPESSEEDLLGEDAESDHIDMGGFCSTVVANDF